MGSGIAPSKNENEQNITNYNICIFTNKISKTAQNTLEIPMVRDMEDWNFSIKLQNILKILKKWTRPVKTGALCVAGAWI